MSEHRILIACVGNIFLGDDAFGVEVAQRLLQRRWPDAVRVVDFGIRGLDLTYALLDGYAFVILVDAAPCGQPPGTLFVLEPDRPADAGLSAEDVLLETHGMNPAKVLRAAAALHAPLPRVLLVGCEPTLPADADEMSMELSPPVRAAVDAAIPLIEGMVHDLLATGDCRFPQYRAGGEPLATGRPLLREPDHPTG